MINKTRGNRFEAELCDEFAMYGWWAHNMAQNKAGQPADVIAAKNNEVVLIDCKVCDNDTFPMSRVEPNQFSAMTLWKKAVNESAFFAMKLSDGSIHMIPFTTIEALDEAEVKTLSKEEIVLYGTPFNDWLVSKQ